MMNTEHHEFGALLPEEAQVPNMMKELSVQ